MSKRINRNDLIKKVNDTQGIESLCNVANVSAMTVKGWIGGMPVGDRHYFALLENELWVSGYILAKYEASPWLTPENDNEAIVFWGGFERGAIDIIQYQNHPDWSLKAECFELLDLLCKPAIAKMIKGSLAKKLKEYCEKEESNNVIEATKTKGIKMSGKIELEKFRDTILNLQKQADNITEDITFPIVDRLASENPHDDCYCIDCTFEEVLEAITNELLNQVNIRLKELN